MSTISFTTKGEPASKSNSRRLVTFGGKPRFIKSEKALNFVKSFQLQCPCLDKLIEEDVSVTMTIYYSTRRPDLDESVVLDAMQGFIYKNDRQVKRNIFTGGLIKRSRESKLKLREESSSGGNNQGRGKPPPH